MPLGTSILTSAVHSRAVLPIYVVVVTVGLLGGVSCTESSRRGEFDVAADSIAADIGIGDVDAFDAPPTDSAASDSETSDSTTDRDLTGDTEPDGPPIPEFVGSWGGRGRDPGEFIEPSSVSIDSNGFVYVAGHEDRFQKFKPDGSLVAIYGSPGGDDGEFNHPHGIVVDQMRGDLVYVGDQENHRLQVFQSDGTFVDAFENQRLEHIHDIGLAPGSGALYVGDLEQDVIRKFGPNGNVTAKYGESGTGPGQYDGVWGLATDSFGNLYVADSNNDRIQKLAADGSFLAQWSDFRGADFQKPTGVFVDQNGIVYVCDSQREEILLFTSDGTELQRWDLQRMTGVDTEPEDLVTDASGENIYVAEVRGHRVLHLAR